MANDITDIAKIITYFTFIIRIEQTRYSFSLLRVVYDLLTDFPIMQYIRNTVRFSKTRILLGISRETLFYAPVGSRTVNNSDPTWMDMIGYRI